MVKQFKRLIVFINPLVHFGEKKYPLLLPFFITGFSSSLIFFYSKYLSDDSSMLGLYAIIVNAILIIYFSFRFGKRGGMGALIATALFYLYIGYTQSTDTESLRDAIYATVIFLIFYLLIVNVVGGLKQIIDFIIHREANEKKRLQTIIEQLPVGIVIADTNGLIIEANNRIEEILGVSLQIGEKIGKHLARVKFPRSKRKVQKKDLPLIRALRTHKVVKDKEFQIVFEDNKIKDVLISSAPIYDQDGVCVAGVSIIQDITPIREHERRKDDFINMASHEFKTPVTSLVLYSEIVRRSLKNNDKKNTLYALDGLDKQTAHLQSLIEVFLDVSRIQIGKITIDKESFRLDQLITDVVNDIEIGRPTRAILIKSNPQIRVFADKQRIKQVLINLLQNAIKFSPENSRVIVSMRRKKLEIIVSVQDFGIGIKKDDQKRIFQKLYQGKNYRPGSYTGLGMGLFISKEIIKKHRGEIWVESKIGKGSTFYVSLPR